MSRLNLTDRIAVTLMFFTATAIAFADRAFAAPSPDVVPMGRVAAARPVLDDAAFRRIAPGMRADEVLSLIGAPQGKIRFERTKTTAWDYPYRDDWGYTAEFSVMIDDAGIVASKFSARLGD